MPFTLRNLKEDLEDVGSTFDGAPDLEFRMATRALALEQSGLSYQSVPPTNRSVAGANLARARAGLPQRLPVPRMVSLIYGPAWSPMAGQVPGRVQ